MVIQFQLKPPPSDLLGTATKVNVNNMDATQFKIEIHPLLDNMCNDLGLDTSEYYVASKIAKVASTISKAALSLNDKWIDSTIHLPPHNLGVLVFIPNKDNHITGGMWDISRKWVLLDEYRDSEVSHWMYLPEPPNELIEKNAK